MTQLIRNRFRAFVAPVLALALAAAPASAATIVIVNLDGAGEGFNDNTPATPVGGNPGNTIGQQRLKVFEKAAEIWGNILPSNVQIRVQAQFNPLSCNSSSAVLGSAGAISAVRDFPGAIFPNTWYHVALGNKLANADLTAGVDDISATFNSSIDNNNNCLAGTNWYYGFDGNEGGNVELLPVVLHELGHGLGFSTFINLSTGQFFNAFPDIYSRFMIDETTGKTWDQMSNGERVASAVNTGNVAWNGPAANFQAPLMLAGAPRLLVNSPPGIAGDYQVGLAAFGAALTETGVTADLVLAVDAVGSPNDACSPLTNGAQMNGKVALIDRGGCTFTGKALAAQNAGAIAVIIADNVAAGTPPGLGGSDPSITIPVVSVTQADGNTLKANLGSGVNVTVGLDPNNKSGMTANGRVRLYAPNPVQGGSSISHWDTPATPNLLMEPFISADLSDDVTLSRYHFEDIGWLPRTTDAPGPLATGVSLRNVMPNPFGPSTTLSFEIGRQGPVSLEIFNVAGRRVKQLLNDDMAPGSYSVSWDGTDDAGRKLSAGVYFSVLRSGGESSSKNLVLLR